MKSINLIAMILMVGCHKEKPTPPLSKPSSDFQVEYIFVNKDVNRPPDALLLTSYFYNNRVDETTRYAKSFCPDPKEDCTVPDSIFYASYTGRVGCTGALVVKLAWINPDTASGKFWIIKEYQSSQSDYGDSITADPKTHMFKFVWPEDTARYVKTYDSED